MKPDMSTYERDKEQMQSISRQNITSSALNSGLITGNPYLPDRWETGSSTTRFSVTKVSNGYILEIDGKAYIAENVEQVQDIVATMLIAKAK
jgi:hypothetical protein